MKAPVFYPDAEQAVLGSMMTESWATRRGLQLLEMKDFDDPRNRIIFEAIGTLMEDSPDELTDAMVINAQITKMGFSDRVGPKYVIDCINYVISTKSINSYVRFVKEASLERQIDRQLQMASQERSSENVKTLGDLILALQGNRGGRIWDMRTDLGPMLDEIFEKPDPGFKTTIGCIDRLVSGNFHPGELWTIGARPGGGKTALMLRLAGEFANQGIEVLYITMEMQIKELIQRLLPMATGIHHKKFRLGDFTTHDINKIMQVAGDMAEMPFKLSHCSFPTIDQIKGAIFNAKPKVVFIDYLQRCQLPRAENMTYQIQAFYVQLKSLLLETGVVGFVGCQSDRELDKNPMVAPMMSHLKGSGAIESESDGVMMLWEPPPTVIAKRLGWVPASPGCDAIEVWFRKNRNGPKNVWADMELNGQLIKMCERYIKKEDML